MTVQLQIADSNGTASGTLDVSDEVFAAPFREPLVHQVVVAYQAAARAGTKAQKNRALVRGGGRKPYRQKGTGRARAGTIRSPLWRGGGKIFPAVPRSYDQKVNRKMYRGAMRAILSELARQERLRIVGELGVSEPKTRMLAGWLKGFGAEGRVLIVVEAFDENLFLAARNLRDVEVCEATDIDPVSLIRFDTVLCSPAAVTRIQEALR